MRIALRAAAAVAWLLLVAPPLALLVFSLDPGAAQRTPSWGISLRAYAALLEPSRLLSALGTSLLLGALATGAALALGIPAALALRRGRVPGRAALMAFLLSPLSLPGIVFGAGLLASSAAWSASSGVQWTGTVLPLFAGHLVFTIPWVTRSVLDSLESLDPAIEEQARSLGAGPLATLLFVTLPGARAGVAAGALGAFALSFGTFAISLPLSGGRTATLPVALYEAVLRAPGPTVAAYCGFAIAIAAAAAFLTARGSDPPRVRGGAARGNDAP